MINIGRLSLLSAFVLFPFLNLDSKSFYKKIKDKAKKLIVGKKGGWKPLYQDDSGTHLNINLKSIFSTTVSAYAFGVGGFKLFKLAKARLDIDKLPIQTEDTSLQSDLKKSQTEFKPGPISSGLDVKGGIDRFAWNEFDNYQLGVDSTYDSSRDIRKGRFGEMPESPIAGAIIDIGMETSKTIGFGLGLGAFGGAVGAAGKWIGSRLKGGSYKPRGLVTAKTASEFREEAEAFENIRFNKYKESLNVVKNKYYNIPTLKKRIFTYLKDNITSRIPYFNRKKHAAAMKNLRKMRNTENFAKTDFIKEMSKDIHVFKGLYRIGINTFKIKRILRDISKYGAGRSKEKALESFFSNKANKVRLEKMTKAVMNDCMDFIKVNERFYEDLKKLEKMEDDKFKIILNEYKLAVFAGPEAKNVPDEILKRTLHIPKKAIFLNLKNDALYLQCKILSVLNSKEADALKIKRIGCKIISLNTKILKRIMEMTVKTKPKKDLFKIFGLSENATKEELKKAYQDFAKKHHPDVSSNPEANKKFQEGNASYEELLKRYEQ